MMRTRLKYLEREEDHSPHLSAVISFGFILPGKTGMLITDGKVSPFISGLIDELGYERVNSVASGNRAMMLLEGKGGAYIRDTGVSHRLW